MSAALSARSVPVTHRAPVRARRSVRRGAVVRAGAFLMAYAFAPWEAPRVALLLACLWSITANADYVVQILRGRWNHAGASIAHIGFALVIFGAVLSTGGLLFIYGPFKRGGVSRFTVHHRPTSVDC